MSLSYLVRNIRCWRIKNNIRTSFACALSSKIPVNRIIKEVDPDTGEIRSKKTNVIPKVTLLSGESVSVITLQEAEKLSTRRNLKLVKIVDIDTKTQRPVYQLMTGAEYNAEELKQKQQRKADRQILIKGEKVLLLNCKIARHDLDTQLKRVVKWIKKMYEVRVVISGATGSVEASEKVYGLIEEYFKNEANDAKLVQKRVKGTDVKFQIRPSTPQTSKEINL